MLDEFKEYIINTRVDRLLKIKEAYSKMIMTRTRHDDCQYEGIQIVDISNWLSRDT